MSTFRFQLAVSLDGFVAGPDQSEENPLGVGPGPWREDRPWDGWRGDNPPFHTPVFVLAHHPRQPLEMAGGTTFVFVTDGIESASEQARKAAGGRDLLLGGGAKVVQQYLAAGLVDEFEPHLVPVLLGTGARPLENVGDLNLEQVRAIEAPGVTHITYRVVRDRNRIMEDVQIKLSGL